MTDATNANPGVEDGITAPLRHTNFRRIWTATVLSHFGTFIQGVAAAWTMAQMTSSADKVALVQTALLLPFMLIAIPAGAIADMHDKRIIGLISQSISLCGAAVLMSLASFDLITPNLLLTVCFIIGTGMALMVPAWQSSIGEQVPARSVPAAVALAGISYNLARSMGPAIGGAIVAAAGAAVAFAVNALLYVPLIIALWLWKRVSEPPRFPRESLLRAMVSGVRYIIHSPSINILLVRTLVTSVITAGIIALMPLVARDVLHGGARAFGFMLSAFGLGAVIGALNLNGIRKRMSEEAAIRFCTVSIGVSVGIVALSASMVLTAAALVVAGAMWTMAWTLFSVCVQLSVPRWVGGRALAIFQAAGTGGIALGSWGWGHLADVVGVEAALMVSAVLMLTSALLGLWLRMPSIGMSNQEAEMLAHPEVRLPITPCSGPIIVELEYRVARKDAMEFYQVIQEIQRIRQRNGAYGWSIACDISDPELWTERFHCPTWLEYLRQRNRLTLVERAIDKKAVAFHIGPDPVRVRRMLERPFASMSSTPGS